MKFRIGLTLFKQAGRKWLVDKAPQMGASLAFYSILSLGPLLLIVISIASLVFDHDTASQHIISSIGSLVGDQGAAAIKDILNNPHKENTNIISVVVGIITLIIGTAGVFGQLQDSLNTIWRVKAKPGQKIWQIIKNRFLSFSMVIGTGFLLLISLVISTALAAMNDYFMGVIPDFKLILHLLNFILSFGIITLLFAMIYKFLPDAKIKWRDVWIASIFTAFLFTIGKFFIGLYLGHSGLSTSYGAAGSLIVLLVWVYYSAQIVFFGAELAEVYSTSSRTTVPAKNADNVILKEIVIKK